MLLSVRLGGPTINELDLVVSDTAIAELKRIFADQNFDLNVEHVRLAVQGGGCSGFQHRFNVDGNVDPNLDIVSEYNGLKFVVDRRSAIYVNGTQIDWVDNMNKRGFKFSNPSIKTTCGCGSSFSM